MVGARGQGAIRDFLAGSTGAALAREAPCPVILIPSNLEEWPDQGKHGPIVCGVDGSDGALNAARHAGDLAQRLGTRLVLAHVGEEADDGAVESVCEQARTAVSGHQIEVQRLQGRVPDELLAFGIRMGAALLAAGSRGRSPIKAAVLGSVSSKLLQRADRPIMIVSNSA